MSPLTGKQVLVTGGCGSIGTQLVERILNQDPAAVRVLDSNEQGLFELKRALREHQESLRFLLGDVRDRERLEMAMEDIDAVFHSAALKHVELNEFNPFETVQTNVQGTQNLIRVAMEEEVESFVGISTDKASNPISVMGATKLLSERLTVAAEVYKGGRSTTFGCVRFGNVLGSSGSVVPIFREQIRNGGPITVTDPEMTRFVMPISEAVDLVLKAHERLAGGEVFVLKMPAIRLGTLADAMKQIYAPRNGLEPDDIATEIIGPRPAERTHEKLISADEIVQAEELEDMFVLLPQLDMQYYDSHRFGAENSLDGEYTSAQAELLSEEDLVALLEKNEDQGLSSEGTEEP